MRAPILTSARARAGDLSQVFAIRPFATYQAGNIVMTTGFWMQRIAIGWLTWEITGSEAWLGLIAFAELFPSILTALWGGALADRHPATRVMFWGQVLIAGLSAALTVGAATGWLDRWSLLAAMTLLGAISGTILPARLAMASWLVPRALLPTALAVNSTGFNLSRFVGPALAAGLLVVAHEAVVFGLSALGFAALAVQLYRIRHVPRQGPVHQPGPPVSTAAVYRAVMATPAVLGVILLQFAQGALIRPTSELFPAFSELAFGMGEAGLGALNAALGLGAIIGALALSKAREPQAALRQILIMSALFALSLPVFVLTGPFALALLVLVVHGLAMSSSNIAALAFVQIQTPPERLGRVLSLYTIVFRVGPALGAFLFGLAAEHTSLRATGLIFGAAGLAATAALAIMILRPKTQWRLRR
ncbi:transporter, putative [Rhodovulum sp. P5]|uniref:MFS transporter n=1 Tax=Rhodovulum sp. P5 TaxID=1564506 RepID=UPI0009C2C78D|nr:MFS transporter [Rhodovulum sp. P5]ARE39025.1 transporter, putative [Rhodovulum sp. P5]